MRANDIILLRRKGGKFSSWVTNTFGSAIIQYLQLAETSGATAEDSGTLNCDGAYTGVALANAVCGKTGTSCPYFDGTNDYVNIASAAFNTAFTGAAGAVMMVVKLATGAWTDGSVDVQFWMQVDASNYCYIRKSNVNNTMSYRVRASATGNGYEYLVPSPPSGFFTMGVSWTSSGTYIPYFSGVAVSVGIAIGAWAGDPAATTHIIGAPDLTPTNPAKGWIGHVLTLNRVATPAEHALWNTKAVG